MRKTKNQNSDRRCLHVLWKVCMDVIMHRTCLNLKSVNYCHYFLLTWCSCSSGAEAVFSPELFCTITFHVHTFTFLYLSEIIPKMKYSVVYRWLGHKHGKTSWYFQVMSLSFFFFSDSTTRLDPSSTEAGEGQKTLFSLLKLKLTAESSILFSGREPTTRLSQNWPMKVKFEADRATGWIWDGNLWADMSDLIGRLAQRPNSTEPWEHSIPDS